MKLQTRQVFLYFWLQVQRVSEVQSSAVSTRLADLLILNTRCVRAEIKILLLCDHKTSRVCSHRGRNWLSPYKRVPVQSHNSFLDQGLEKSLCEFTGTIFVVWEPCPECCLLNFLSRAELSEMFQSCKSGTEQSKHLYSRALQVLAPTLKRLETRFTRTPPCR